MTLIEGDGIGPEISESVKDIFAAAKVCRDDVFAQRSELTLSRRPFNGSPSMLRRN